MAEKAEVKFDLKKGLNAWVEQNTSIKAFSLALGYQYTNAWTILRGKQPVTVEAVGRFALAYGPAALAEMLELAGLGETLEVTFRNGVPSAMPVKPEEPVYVKAEETA